VKGNFIQQSVGFPNMMGEHTITIFDEGSRSYVFRIVAANGHLNVVLPSEISLPLLKRQDIFSRKVTDNFIKLELELINATTSEDVNGKVLNLLRTIYMPR
jgi:hypothetical protein